MDAGREKISRRHFFGLRPTDRSGSSVFNAKTGAKTLKRRPGARKSRAVEGKCSAAEPRGLSAGGVAFAVLSVGPGEAAARGHSLQQQGKVVEGHGSQQWVGPLQLVKGGRRSALDNSLQDAVGVGYVSIIHFLVLILLGPRALGAEAGPRPRSCAERRSWAG